MLLLKVGLELLISKFLSNFLCTGCSEMMNLDDIEATVEQDFLNMLVNLSHHIGEKDLELMKFYCNSFVPAGRLDEITQAVQLWPALREKERISCTDTSFLRELLEKAVGRMDLLRIVDDYEQQLGHKNTKAPCCDSGLLCFFSVLISCIGSFTSEVGFYRCETPVNLTFMESELSS